MSENDQKKEIRRLRNLLLKMMELAEHVEQTGSFESGVRNSVKRYNAIVDHLEDNEAIPENMFPRLEENADSGQLGAEAMLLADFLKDIAEEEEAPSRGGKEGGKGFDLGPIIALAPFLGSQELSRLVREHFPGTKNEREERNAGGRGMFDIKTLVGLAPHIDPEELGRLVRAAVESSREIDPKMLVALAPHLRREDLSALLQVMEAKANSEANNTPPVTPPAPPTPPTPPSPPARPAPPAPPAPTPGAGWQGAMYRPQAGQAERSETGEGSGTDGPAPEPGYLSQ